MRLLKELKEVPHSKITESAYMTSSAVQDERVNKLFAAKKDDGFNLLYMWVKQDVISRKEFKELVTWFMKE